MTKKCPKCKNYQEVNILYETKAEDTLDNLGHLHIECKMCGRQFNIWTSNKKEVKKIFGESYEFYK
jgi:hypothetical protein